jgi:hypothetical protein
MSDRMSVTTYFLILKAFEMRIYGKKRKFENAKKKV